MTKENPHYIGHRERLRKRFLKSGAEGFHDYEILELLLTYSIPRVDVKPLAKKLLGHFGSLSRVFDASRKEIEEIQGLGSASVTLIKLVKGVGSKYLAEKMEDKDFLSCPSAVFEFSRFELEGRSHEAFMVIYLNTKNKVIHHEILQEGDVDTVAVYPRRVVESALSHHSSGLILAHNHPSGNPIPSEEDKRLTKDIASASSTLSIRVLDHVIVGKDTYFSFAEHNLLPANVG